MKDISFIIPVYNSEEYIESCVNSIAIQHGLDYEIILVDDGSKDNSGKICDSLAETNKNIIVIHQKNKGICGARNAAIKNSTGRWMCFVDNDDIVNSKAFKVISDNLESQSDIIYFGFDEFSTIESIIDEDAENKKIEFNKEDIKKLQWDCLCRYRDNIPKMSARLQTTPWGKIYKSEFIKQNNILFIEDLKREEDVTFNLICLAHCKKAEYIPFKLYHYRRFIGSESHSYKENIVDDAVTAIGKYREILDEFYHNRPDMEELYEYRKLWEVLYCVVLKPAHINNPATYKKRKEQFKEIVSIEEFRNALDTRDINRLGKMHRILAKNIKNGHFRTICLLTHMENLLNKVKFR